MNTGSGSTGGHGGGKLKSQPKELWRNFNRLFAKLTQDQVVDMEVVVVMEVVAAMEVVAVMEAVAAMDQEVRCSLVQSIHLKVIFLL